MFEFWHCRMFRRMDDNESGSLTFEEFKKENFFRVMNNIVTSENHLLLQSLIISWYIPIIGASRVDGDSCISIQGLHDTGLLLDDDQYKVSLLEHRTNLQMYVYTCTEYT